MEFGYEDPDVLRRRLKLGREEFGQRLLTSLIVGGAYPRWNTRNQPSERGLRFLSDLDHAAFGTRHDGVPAFVDELELLGRHEDDKGCAPDYGVLWPDRLWMIELKTERGSHSRGQLSSHFELGRHHFPDLQLDLLYLTPPMERATPTAPADSRFAYLYWGEATRLIDDVWNDSTVPAERRIAQRLAVEIDGLVMPASEWRASAAAPSPTPMGAARTDPRSTALELADAVELHSRQRALDLRPDSLDELLELRVELRDTLRRDGSPTPHVRPWLWRASSSGGRALTPGGEMLGYEVQLSYYPDP